MAKKHSFSLNLSSLIYQGKFGIKIFKYFFFSASSISTGSLYINLPLQIEKKKLFFL